MAIHKAMYTGLKYLYLFIFSFHVCMRICVASLFVHICVFACSICVFVCELVVAVSKAMERGLASVNSQTGLFILNHPPLLRLSHSLIKVFHSFDTKKLYITEQI